MQLMLEKSSWTTNRFDMYSESNVVEFVGSTTRSIYKKI